MDKTSFVASKQNRISKSQSSEQSLQRWTKPNEAPLGPTRPISPLLIPPSYISQRPSAGGFQCVIWKHHTHLHCDVFEDFVALEVAWGQFGLTLDLLDMSVCMALQSLLLRLRESLWDCRVHVNVQMWIEDCTCWDRRIPRIQLSLCFVIFTKRLHQNWRSPTARVAF